MVEHVKRFGAYGSKLKRTPDNWIPDEAFQLAAAPFQDVRRAMRKG